MYSIPHNAVILLDDLIGKIQTTKVRYLELDDLPGSHTEYKRHYGPPYIRPANVLLGSDPRKFKCRRGCALLLEFIKHSKQFVAEWLGINIDETRFSLVYEKKSDSDDHQHHISEFDFHINGPMRPRCPKISIELNRSEDSSEWKFLEIPQDFQEFLFYLESLEENKWWNAKEELNWCAEALYALRDQSKLVLMKEIWCKSDFSECMIDLKSYKLTGIQTKIFLTMQEKSDSGVSLDFLRDNNILNVDQRNLSDVFKSNHWSNNLKRLFDGNQSGYRLRYDLKYY